jgi:peptidoglycan LD-endopeptidase LytH
MAHATRVRRKNQSDNRYAYLRAVGLIPVLVGAFLISAPIAEAKPAKSAKTAAKPTDTTPVVRLAAAATVPPAAVTIVSAGGDIDDLDIDAPIGGPASVGKPIEVSANGWVCPLPQAKFTNDWGQSRPGGRSHTGTDMLAPHGSPIFAPLAGTVSFKGSSRGGNSFYLKTGDGITLFGAHLSSYGQAGKVKAGTIIGYVGDTGNANGTPHLHLEIQKGKAKTNPFPVLSSACAA